MTKQRERAWAVLFGVETTPQVSIDPNGNLCAESAPTNECGDANATRTYEWDAADRLIEVKQGAGTLASFSYDGNGRRTAKASDGVTTSYVYEGAQFLEERPSALPTRRYVYGPKIDLPLAQVVGGTTTYNVADHMRSVVRTTTAIGGPASAREYDLWGNPIQGSATSGFAYTGREWDSATGLYFYRARYYAPKLGRFMSEDPLGRALGDKVSPYSDPRYAYVRNNPLRFVDPTGLVTWDCDYVVDTYGDPTGPGGGLFGFVCKSRDCVGGLRVVASITGVVTGTSVGPLPIGVSLSTATLDDPYPVASGKNLEGMFHYASVGVVIGLVGYSYTRITLGSAKGSGFSETFGLDAGLDVYFGTSKLRTETKECCGP